MEASTLLLTILTLCIIFYYFVFHKTTHFEQLKIPHVRPIPVLGNMAPFILQRLATFDLIRKFYNQFSETKYFGFYTFMTPVIIIRDMELINSIAIKNFDYFCDHNASVNKEIDSILSKNLFNLKGDEWREKRKILSPIFTSGKLKMMFELMSDCAENFADSMAAESKNGKIHDMKDILRRYANDVIATCAFGIHVDSFKNSNNDFLRIGKESLIFNYKLFLKFSMHKNFPLLSKLLKIKMVSSKIKNFFKDVVSSTVKMRRENGIVRPDMIQLLMEGMGKDDKINIDYMTSQAFLFFVAGFDGISNSMCFLAHEVGVNPDIQSKLQAEIDEVLRQNNGKPTYEAINNMKYLDAVVNESLRLYPGGGFLDRQCVKEFELPPATPDSKPIMLKPGDNILLPVYAIHHDPQYFPAPHRFDPNRFLEDQVNNSVYMPFGIGPRICIANRFALMESKIMLFYLLSRCDLEPTPKTNIPMVLDKSTMMMMAEGGFWLKLRTRKSTAFDKQ